MEKLNEANSPDLILYQDDNTGDCYYWNGKELIFLYNRKPQIGDKGEADYQDKEDQEREAQRAKEREEAQRAKDAGEEYDEDALAEESEEERQQRINDIQDILGDEQTAEEATKESRTKVDRELARKKAADLRNSSSSKIQRFKQSLDKFIANEVRPRRNRTWQKSHMGYEGSGILRQGRRIERNDKIPKINVYFDQSGSWDESDIAVGMEAVGVLKNYEDRNEIKVELYYFSNDIYSDAQEARYDGGTGAGAKLINHIRATNPDNVIVMTDDDIGTGWKEIYDAPKTKVPGAVWYLFRGAASPALPEWLKGRKQTSVFII